MTRTNVSVSRVTSRTNDAVRPHLGQRKSQEKHTRAHTSTEQKKKKIPHRPRFHTQPDTLSPTIYLATHIVYITYGTHSTPPDGRSAGHTPARLGVDTLSRTTSPTRTQILPTRNNLFFHWYSRRIDNEYICRAYVLYSRYALTWRVLAKRLGTTCSRCRCVDERKKKKKKKQKRNRNAQRGTF